MTAIRAIVFVIVLACGAGAQTTLRWIADTARPAPADWPVYQGETVALEPSFQTYGETLPLTNVTAALWWQTNGMGSAWWTAPATVITGTLPRIRAAWSPTNDVGAMRYTYFISAAAAGGTMYRAFGTLMMRASPGSTPSVLAAPTTLTDAIRGWADLRYDPAGAAMGVSNALAGAADHAATAHSVTAYGGFQAGYDVYISGVPSTAEEGAAVGQYAQTKAGAAVGQNAYSADGGAAGHLAVTDFGGAVGAYANSVHGGALGFQASAGSGGAVGQNASAGAGFAGGADAYATDSGDGYGNPIDAVQLGSGANTEPGSLGVYTYKMMSANGTIPLARMALHNTNTVAHADIRALVNGAILATGGTMTGELRGPEGISTNAYIIRDQLMSEQASASLRTFYLDLNGADLLTLGGRLYAARPTVEAGYTYSAAPAGSSQTLIFWSTNTCDLIRSGRYLLQISAVKSSGSASMNARLELVATNTATGGALATLATGDYVSIRSTRHLHRLPAALHDSLPGTGLRLGARIRISVSGSGTATYGIYVGGANDSRLETPGAGAMAGTVYAAGVTNIAAGVVSTHDAGGAAHADIRALIDTNAVAIAAIPTNIVSGWLVWDSGSNCYWRVSATNLRFHVWGVDP